MTLLRDKGSVDDFRYLGQLGLPAEDLGRLTVAEGTVSEGGVYLEATTGEVRLLASGEDPPAGTWVAQREVDDLSTGPGTRDEPHGFGEGWGDQAAQLGGDRSYPEEDSGGVRRVPHPEAE